MVKLPRTLPQKAHQLQANLVSSFLRASAMLSNVSHESLMLPLHAEVSLSIPLLWQSFDRRWLLAVAQQLHQR